MEIREKILSLYKDGLSGLKISEELSISKSRVYKILKEENITRSNRENSRKFKINHKFFSSIDSERKAYWLGFMYADGYLVKRSGRSYFIGISLSSKDEDHLRKIVKDMDSDYPINRYINNIGVEYSRFMISSEQIYNDLFSLGCTTNKSCTLKFPGYKEVPESLMHHFMRGYFDGDGSYSKNSKLAKSPYSIKICGTIEFIKGIVREFNINKYYIGKRHKNTTNNYSLEINDYEEIVKFSKAIYKDSTIYLERKHNRMNEIV